MPTIAESKKNVITSSTNLSLQFNNFYAIYSLLRQKEKKVNIISGVTHQNIKRNIVCYFHTTLITRNFIAVTMGLTTSNAAKLADENLESLSLIWLDANVNSSSENIDVQKRLRSVINYLKTFHDAAECENYIRSVPDGDRVLFIVSGRLGREMVPRIYKLRQVLAIYVFCNDKSKHEQWTQHYAKVILYN